jgi:hypothetical protein
MGVSRNGKTLITPICEDGTDGFFRISQCFLFGVTLSDHFGERWYACPKGSENSVRLEAHKMRLLLRVATASLYSHKAESAVLAAQATSAAASTIS